LFKVEDVGFIFKGCGKIIIIMVLSQIGVIFIKEIIGRSYYG